jgi:hypothetical protein
MLESSKSALFEIFAALGDISRTVNLWVIPPVQVQLGQNASLFGSDGFRVFWEAYESIQHQARRRSSRFRRQARGAAVALASVDMANIQVEDILAGTPAVQCKTKVRHPFPSAPAAFAPRRK